MSDKDESSEESDYWGGVYTNNPGRAADKTGWGERKESVTPARQSWGEGGSTRRDTANVNADKGWSDTPATRDVEGDVVREPVKHETPGAKLISPAFPPPARIASISPLMIVGVAGVVLLLFLVVTNTGRRGSDTSGATINVDIAGTSSIAFVNTKELNVRVCPGSEYTAITKLAHGDQLTRIGEGQSADGGQWARVRFGSVEGWVNQKLISDTKPPPLVEEASAGGSAAGSVFGNTVFSMGSVGGTQVVGMTVSEASQALGVRLIGEGEDPEGCFYVEPAGGNEGLLSMVTEGTIARFDINDNKVQYEGGIRVGDSEAKLRSVFGESLEVEPHDYDEQGKYYKLTKGNLGVVFKTDGKRVTRIRSGRSPEVEYIEGCS